MPKTKDNDFEYTYTDDPVCPYCDCIYYIGCDCLDDIGNEDNLYRSGHHEVECKSCKNKYEILTHIVRTFSTDKKDI